MDYTHYWYRSRSLDAALFEKASKDCSEICRHLGISIQKDYIDGAPAVFTRTLVRFNGVEDDGHETFVIPKTYNPEFEQKDENGSLFQFCKTAYKAYDICVTCCLIIFKHYFVDQNIFRVLSDGDDEDWKAAREQCQSCLGYGSDFNIND